MIKAFCTRLPTYYRDKRRKKIEPRGIFNEEKTKLKNEEEKREKKRSKEMWKHNI